MIKTMIGKKNYVYPKFIIAVILENLLSFYHTILMLIYLLKIVLKN